MISPLQGGEGEDLLLQCHQMLQPRDLNLKSLTKKQFVDATAFSPSFYKEILHLQVFDITLLFLCLLSHFPKRIYKARPQVTSRNVCIRTGSPQQSTMQCTNLTNCVTTQILGPEKVSHQISSETCSQIHLPPETFVHWSICPKDIPQV